MKESFKRTQPLFRIPVIFGLGSGGGRILSQVRTSAFGAQRVAINNSERDLALLRRVDEKLCVGEDRSGSGMDLEKGRMDFLHDEQRLVKIVSEQCKKKKLTEPDIIPIIASLGHGFGSAALPEATRLLKQSFPSAVLFAFAITPFDFQGEGIKDRARESLRRCRKGSITTTPISNQAACEKIGLDPKTLPLVKLYGRINDDLSELLTALFEALTAKGGVVESLDRNDLRRIWTGVSSLIMMARYPTISAIGPMSIADAERRLYLKMDYEPSEQPSTVTYVIDGPGDVTVNQLTEINALLVEKYKASLDLLKPLIVQRKKPHANLMLIRGNVNLDLEAD
jgi:cell division GTPase FtsZ